MEKNLETTYTFRNMDATDALKVHTDKRLKRVKKFLLHKDANAHIIFKLDGSSSHTAEVTIHFKGTRYVGRFTSHDMYGSIDNAIERIETQLHKNKDRITAHKGE